MKAFIARSYGGPEVMALSDLPEPSAARGEVVVAVKASSVNPVDWKARDGALRLVTGGGFPKPYGCDLAGVVHALGPGVSAFSVGDSVYGYTPILFGRHGAHAERVAVAVKHLRRIPSGIDFEQAAALPVAALTAQNGLRLCGDVAGKSILVNGATGGVGHFAVQLARVRGAKVTAVCSGRNARRARALGAEAVIDYRAQDFTAEGAHHDVLFDAFGHLSFDAGRRALTPRGCFVTTLGNPTLFVRGIWQALTRGKRIVFANLRDRQEDYDALEAQLVAGRVKPIVEKVFSLDQAAEAFEALEAGGTVGKVVIRVA
jgi:NADPH:quinone reductase-like Zn-dependent oxidoreductase